MDRREMIAGSASASLVFLAGGGCLHEAVRIRSAMHQTPPAIDVSTGSEIPSEGYCDPPYVVKLDNGKWLCVMTTGNGREGARGQHIVACHTSDHGETWGPRRNPAYLLGGVEVDGPDGKLIQWGRPVAVLYDKNPKVRISYPDFIRYEGAFYITETQKLIARVHRIPGGFLARLWED